MKYMYVLKLSMICLGIRLKMKTIIIIGASSYIAQSTSKALAKTLPNHQQILISSKADHLTTTNAHLTFNTDYSEQSIQVICKQLTQYQISHVFIFNGLLHQQSSEITIKPEKRLEDIQLNNLHHIFTINLFNTAIWLNYLSPHLKHSEPCYLVVLSARVGSISDNKLGGWYAYRASKAGLNMLLKTAAIEFAHRAKNVKVIAFHPGTTDTNLSKPFHANIPKDKLFTPDFVANCLLSVITQVPLDNQLSYVDWQGKSLDF